MSTTQARQLADGLREALLAERRAQAERLHLVTELALEYRVEEDELLEVATERRRAWGAAGTPLASEFLALEVAALLQRSVQWTACHIAEAMNLRWRHPSLWVEVAELRLEASRALRAAGRCADLDPAVADEVGRRWAARQAGLGWVAAFRLLDELVVAADPEGAAAKELTAQQQRGISMGECRDGNVTLTAVLDPVDARFVTASVDEMAQALEDQGLDRGRGELRAKALGILATPALALRVQQEAAQPSLVPVASDGGLDGLLARLPRPGTDAVGDAAQLAPRVTVVAHVMAEDLLVHARGGMQGAATIEHVGAVTLSALTRMLDGKQVTLRPVIDLNDFPAQDGYRPSARMREAVGYVFGYEAFPWSTRRVASCDLDHTVAYLPSGGPGQTRIGNLAPLTRTAHRAKTAGLWRATQPSPGRVVWGSPLGYRYEVTPRGTVALE